MRGFRRLVRKPLPKRKRTIPKLPFTPEPFVDRRPGFLQRHRRWLVIPGALLAAASFLAKDVYLDHINGTVDDVGRQIAEAASPDESPLSQAEKETAHKACKFPDTKELLQHFSDHVMDISTETLGCSLAVGDIARKLRDLNQETDELRAHIVVSDKENKSFDALEEGSNDTLARANSAVVRCKGITDSLVEEILGEHPPQEDQKTMLAGAMCATDRLSIGMSDADGAYDLGLSYRKLVIRHARAYVNQRETQGRMSGRIVIALFFVGWLAHLSGSLLGVSVDSGA